MAETNNNLNEIVEIKVENASRELTRSLSTRLDSIANLSFKRNELKISAKQRGSVKSVSQIIQPNNKSKLKKNEEFEFQSLESDSNSGSKKSDRVEPLVLTLTNLSEKKNAQDLVLNKEHSVKLLTFDNPSQFHVFLLSREKAKNQLEYEMNKFFIPENYFKYLTEEDEIAIGKTISFTIIRILNKVF